MTTKRCNSRQRAAASITAVACLPGLWLTCADAAEPLDEIVVTARRQSDSLRTYAGSVSRISAEDIARLGSTHHSELINRAPGALIQRNSGQESLTAIRSPVLTGPGSCGVFLFLEDSVPIRPVGFCNVNELFEVNSEQSSGIEVLRGPAGVVYGSGAMHGAVNLIQARAGQRGSSLALEGGPDEFYRAKGVWQASVADTDFRVQGVATHDGGWRAQSGLEEQKLNLAVNRELDTAKLGLTLSATNLNQETAGFIQGRDAFRNEAISRANPNPEAFRDAYAVRVVGHYERPLRSDAQLDVRPYLRSSRMDFLQHFLIGKPLEENGQDSLGVLASLRTTLGSNTQLITGIDLERTDGFLKETQAGPATDGAPAANLIRPAGQHYDYEVASSVAALYGQLTQPLAEVLELSGGLRFEYVDYDYDNRILAGNTRDDGTSCTPAGCLYSRPADRDDKFSNLTARVGLAWSLTPSHTVFVTAGRGYRAPDTSELYRLQRTQSAAGLEAEQLDNAELGARGDVGAVRYSLAVYRMDKDHVIFRDANGFNISDGNTAHRGVEYELSWSLLDNLSLSAAGSYAKHTYEFDRAVEGGETIVAGRDIDTAPRHVHAARLNWSFLTSADAELEFQSVGSYFADAANANRYGGHELLNLRLGWSFANSWSARLRLNNVTDREYADRADFAFGSFRYFPGRGRTLFVELSYQPR
jgi:outer membrane receptor protein involved in Fe transport